MGSRPTFSTIRASRFVLSSWNSGLNRTGNDTFSMSDVGSAIQEMCFRHSDGRAIAGQVAMLQFQNKESSSVIRRLIDSAERIELVYARRKLAVFNVRHPSVGQIYFPAVLVLRDLLTFLFDIAGAKSKADAQFFQPFSRHWDFGLRASIGG